MVHYVPAGIEAYTGSPSHLYAKYKTNAEEQTKFGIKYKEWELSDRTLTYVRDGTKHSIRAKNAADEMTSLHSADFVRSAGFTKILANPIHREFASEPFVAAGIESIIDSGGFQMLKGTVDFVEPDSVIERYNRTASIGMPLDIPVFRSVESLYFEAISHVIKANDEYIGSRLKSGIDLALISHGTNLDLRRRRLDVLDRDAKVIAIAGLNIKPEPGTDHLFNSVESMMYVIQRYHKTARYFHVLGVTSKLFMFLYSIIDGLGYVKSIGGDSVSHRLGALVGMYDKCDFTQVTLSKKTKYRTPLPCGCPVCSLVDDGRIIQECVLLENHNLWVRGQQTELISRLARDFLAGNIKLGEISNLLGLKTDLPRLQLVVDYIQEVVAADKFKRLRIPNGKQSLFGGNKVEKPNPKQVEHVKAIINRYEKFHGKKFYKGK